MTPNNPSPPNAAATDEAAFEAWRFAETRDDQERRRDLARAYNYREMEHLAFLAGRSSQRPSPSVGREEVATALYDAFWARQPRRPDGSAIVPWKDQAEAIKVMWQGIAQDAERLAQPATGAVEGE